MIGKNNKKLSPSIVNFRRNILVRGISTILCYLMLIFFFFLLLSESLVGKYFVAWLVFYGISAPLGYLKKNPIYIYIYIYIYMCIFPPTCNDEVLFLSYSHLHIQE